MGTIVDDAEVLLHLNQLLVTDQVRALIPHAITQAEAAIRSFLHYNPAQATHIEILPKIEGARGGRQGVWEVTDTHAYAREVAAASSSVLFLTNLPIRSITSLYLDYDARNGTQTGAFGDSTLKSEGSDYWPQNDAVDVDSNEICLTGAVQSYGRWPTEPGTVKVTYVGGYTAKEFRGQGGSIDATPIWSAALNEAVRRLKKADVLKGSTRLGIGAPALSSEKVGDYTANYDNASLQSILSLKDPLEYASVRALQPFVNYGIAMGG